MDFLFYSDLLGHVSKSPDHELVVHLAQTYANGNPEMKKGDRCEAQTGDWFPNGITNGAKWYCGIKNINPLFKNKSVLGIPTLPSAISLKSNSSRRALWLLICFYMKQC
jgi:hypothetical protein